MATYGITISGTTYTVTMAPLAYTVTMSQVGPQGVKGDTGTIESNTGATIGGDLIVNGDVTLTGSVDGDLPVTGELTASQYNSTEALPDIKPSLNLDFANTKALDPRITYTRGSTATYYDGKTFAKAEENLILQSQAWGTSPWANNDEGSGNVVVNNAAAAPDGTTTATSITFGAPFAARNQQRPTLSGESYVFSFWAKNVDGNTNLKIQHFASATGGSTDVTITSSWARYSVTVLGKSGGGGVAFGILDANASGQGETLFWGAQLEQRSALTDYTVTTTQPITNYVPVLQTAASGEPRFDHDPITGESKGFLIEEQRTNLLTYSEQFDNAAWSKNSSSITSNIVVAPDGMLTGDKLVVNNGSAANDSALQSAAITADAVHCVSGFFKFGGLAAGVRIGSTQSNNGFRATYNIQTGENIEASAIGTGTLVAHGIQDVGNGWYRVWAAGTITAGSTSAAWRISLVDASNSVETGDGYSGVYIWGAQLEQGSFPTSYIPTVASQVTRSPDAASMTGTNFSSWYRQDEGTVYSDLNIFGLLGGVRDIILINDGTASNRIVLRAGQQITGADIVVTANGVSQVDVNSFPTTTLDRVAFAHKLNDFAAKTNNNASFLTDSNALMPVTDQLRLNSVNAHFKKLAYYPKRLSNQTLQALTEE